MKKLFVFVLFLLISLQAFCHKAQKQTEQIKLEPLTEKWIECTAAEGEEYEKRFSEFYEEV